jgi:hypothetical protein
MSSAFNRLNYDVNTYQYDVARSVAPGSYVLNTPMPHCKPCLTPDARVHQGTSGAAMCEDRPQVDVGSELLGLPRRATRCPAGKYRPRADGGAPCGLRMAAECKSNPLAEDTRLSNPAATLRGTGWNRWEWLCQDPQERALVPFDFNINNRTITKDNHRPHLPRPLDQSGVLPPRGSPAPAETRWGACAGAGMGGAGGGAPAEMQWRSCGELAAIRDGPSPGGCCGNN